MREPLHHEIPSPSLARRLAVPALALALAGCNVGPDFVRPIFGQDSRHKAAAAAAAETIEPAQRIAVGEKISGNWWQLFRSERLDDVLGRAIRGNRNIAAARATLAQANALTRQVEGARWPQLFGNGGVTRAKSNLASSGAPDIGSLSNLYTLGLNVRFDLDLFGMLARDAERQGAIADIQAQQLNAAYLTLTGEAVTQAITIASLRAQIDAVEDIIAQDERKIEAVQKLLRIQEATRIDLLAAESQLATDRTLLPPLKQQLSLARHTLALLVGRAPAEWTPPEFDLAEFELPREVPLSLPSELVRQRPDILAAEANLHAASASIGVATAQLYPNISLSGGLTQQGLTPAALFGPQAMMWNIAAGVVAPIFNGGRLMAQKDAAEAAYDAARYGYEQTVLEAFVQVANLMDALEHGRQTAEAQKRALDATQGSAKATRDSFLGGETRFLQVLDAERLYNQARLGYIRAVAQRYIDTTQFFVAMGGAWWDWQAREAAGEAPTDGPSR